MSAPAALMHAARVIRRATEAGLIRPTSDVIGAALADHEPLRGVAAATTGTLHADLLLLKSARADYPVDRQGLVPMPVNEAMNETMPDRLSVNPKSPHYDEAALVRGIGIRFNGVEKTNVEEYCVSEGWVRVGAGRARDRHGNPMTIKLKGEVVPYFQDATDTP